MVVVMAAVADAIAPVPGTGSERAKGAAHACMATTIQHRPGRCQEVHDMARERGRHGCNGNLFAADRSTSARFPRSPP
jgi:hypothetical protein